MAHGLRPQMVMAVTEDRLLLMPMSSSLFRGLNLPAIDGWHRVAYPAPNRVWAVARAGVTADRPRLTRQAVIRLAWAAWDAYEATRPHQARSLASRAGVA